MTSNDITVMLAGYMAGVVFGSIVSVTIYRVLVETGRLKQFGIR
jgi:hypothetical protein